MLPDIFVEVGFTGGASTGTVLHLDDASRGLLDTGTLAVEGILTDVADFLQQLSTQRGSNRADGPVVRYEAGTSTAVLRNIDRRFDPTNLDGPYVSGGRTEVEPMRVVRYRATWGGVTYNVWRGFADNWDLGYDKSLHNSQATLTATDGFKVLENNTRLAVSAVGAGEDSGARVERILDSAAWETADRVIAEGDTSVQATTLSGSALTELFLVTDTEIGEFYMDGAGRAVFRNRHALLTDARSNEPQAIFGPGTESDVYVDEFTEEYVSAPDLLYDDVAIAYDDEQLINLAQIARTGGTQQVAEDTDSQARYLIHSHERTDLVMETDAVAADYARFLVHLSKDPELRFSELRLRPARDPDNLFPQALGREIGDRIRVKLVPPGGGEVIERECFIRGIAHEVNVPTKEWTTVFQLQSATGYSVFLLDDASLGVLDANALTY
jgi:hypothetical protein